MLTFASAVTVSNSVHDLPSLDSRFTGFDGYFRKGRLERTVSPDRFTQCTRSVHTLDYDFKIADGTTVNDGDTAYGHLTSGAVLVHRKSSISSPS